MLQRFLIFHSKNTVECTIRSALISDFSFILLSYFDAFPKYFPQASAFIHIYSSTDSITFINRPLLLVAIKWIVEQGES